MFTSVYLNCSSAQSQHRGRTHAQQGCTLQLAKAQRAKIAHCSNKWCTRKENPGSSLSPKE